MVNIFIGGAWPYANGSIHVGHLAALLPGDVIARYYRQKGENVLYVSGSDCNGTPISIRANQENTTVKEIADRYHHEFAATFTKLGFTYDLYTRTDADHHHRTVQEIFLQLLDNGYLYKKKVEQAYCTTDKQFIHSHNGELLGAFANFVNRTLKFIEKSFASKVEDVQIDKEIKHKIEFLYTDAGEQIEKGNTKHALERIFEFVREGNRYFDERKPWIHVKDNSEQAKETLTNCVYMIQNLAQLLRPFLPFAADKIAKMLQQELTAWHPITILPTYISDIQPLYERIDLRQIDEEMEKLKLN